MRISKDSLEKLLNTHTLEEISDMYGVSKSTISRAIKKHNLRRKNYGSRKLCKDKALKIRELHDHGDYTQQELAEMFEVTQAAIGRIINNVTYKRDESNFSGSAIIRVGYRHGN